MAEQLDAEALGRALRGAILDEFNRDGPRRPDQVPDDWDGLDQRDRDAYTRMALAVAAAVEARYAGLVSVARDVAAIRQVAVWERTNLTPHTYQIDRDMLNRIRAALAQLSGTGEGDGG